MAPCFGLSGFLGPQVVQSPSQSGMFIYLALHRFHSVYGQFGMMIQLEINPDSSKIPVLSLQEKVLCIFSVGHVMVMHYFQGYASDSSFAQYNGTIDQPLASFTFCLRLQVRGLRGKSG